MQRIIVISKIKYKYFYLDFLLFYFIILDFYIILYYFIILKNVLLHVWRCEKKNTVTLNWFHVLNMFKKFPRLKSFTCFLTHKKTAQFVVRLIVLGKWKVSAGLQIHPKNTLRRTNGRRKREKKARKARKYGTWVRHVSRKGL